MIKKLNIAFLWHMHQPSYLDPLTNTFIMPWVRLHALKDYMDIPYAMMRNKNAKFNINFVPSLLNQLDFYIDEKYSDDYLVLSKKNSDNLTDWDKHFIIKNFFNINTEKIVYKSPRYKELFHQKENLKEHNWIKSFTSQDLRDLQIHFNIGWSGNGLIQNSEFIKKLIEKDRNFTEEEKQQLLFEQKEYLLKVKNFIKSLALNQNIEVSVTPFYHPIIPVMNDIDNVQKSWESSVIPNNFNTLKYYSQKHVDNAIDFSVKYFGKKVNGMWPAEGSVSHDFIELINNKIEWIATDEAILMKSMKRNLSIDELSSPYKYKNTYMFFRNHSLSDKIGFVYSNWNKEDSAKDFLNELNHIRSILTKENALVTVILDGENAWEYYENNGEPFLEHLFGVLSSTEWLNLTTFSEYISQNKNNIPVLEHLTPGSWIDGNFNTWINEPTKNKYWSILFHLQSIIENLQKNNLIDSELFKEVEKYFMIAQGSDWMWWAGEGHSSANDLDFDRLFRNYVIKVYQLLKMDVPGELYQPLYTQAEHISYIKPLRLIHPRITGEYDDYFGWHSSGQIIVEQGAIHKTETIIESVLFGFDIDNFYFQVKVHNINKFIENNYDIEIDFIDYKKIDLKTDNNVIYKCKEVIECSIPIYYINLYLKRKDKIKFRIEVKLNGNIVEKLPNSEVVEITVPDESFDMENWSV